MAIPAVLLVVAAATVIVIVLLTGGEEGGSSANSGGGGSGGDVLSRANFVAEADAICTRARVQVLELGDQPTSATPEAAAHIRELAAIHDQELAELDDLQPPDELAAAMGRYIEERERSIELQRQAADAAEAGDAKTFAAAEAEHRATQDERAELAQEAGLEVCSQPSNL